MGWQDAAIAPVAGRWQDAPIVVPEPPAGFKMDAPWMRDAIPLQDAPFSAPDNALQQHFQDTHARAATSFDDYISAGFQQSVTGLASRRKAPDVELDANAPWYGRFMSTVAGIAGDVPAMVPGFMAGGAVGSAVAPGPGTVIGGFAGAAALPAALRSAMMQSYAKGEVRSAADFVDRALETAWETSKAAIVGGFTGGSGIVAKAALPVAAPIAARVLAPTAAQVTTMATVGKALEGQLPEPQDFMDAALVIGGFHVAGDVAGRLRTIYAKTGKTPTEVAVDASRDPAIKADLLAGTPIERTVAQVAAEWPIPEAYKPLAAAETVRAALPDEGHALNISAILSKPYGEVPADKTPNYLNFRYVEAPEDVQAISARVSEVFQQQISEARGSESWDATREKLENMMSEQAKQSGATISIPENFDAFRDLAANSLKTLAIAQRTAFDIKDRNAAMLRDPTPENVRALVDAVNMAAMAHAVDQGAGAEIARALNVRKASKQAAEFAKSVQDLTAQYGSDPIRLGKMIEQLDSVDALNRFARDASKATTYEKVIEAWKAGLVSGPVTHLANIMGNGIFAAMRLPVDTVAAGFSMLRGGADRVTAAEPLARSIGALAGTMDGLRIGLAVLKSGEEPGKAEQFRKAIEGTTGEIVRLPFRALSAEDAVFRTMNERGEAYALAARQAVTEGINPLSREFRERIVQLANDPTPDMAKAIEQAGQRFTFNSELGEQGQALQAFVRKLNLQWAMPFIRTPGNILKEMARMTPLAPMIKEWREDFAKGGSARDKALAEVTVGTGISSVVFMQALNGNITGAGDPDPNKRRVQAAAGWQPYSWKIGGTYYNYQRLQPIGTLVGMAADVAEVWDHMSEDERDKVPKMLSVAFANAVTNQTALQGLTSVVQVLADPSRYGARFVQQYAGSLVPSLVAQPTQMLDPVVREVNSMTDAVKARLPGFRSDLLPKRDVFGEPQQTKERAGAISPVTETTESTDKVRAEAARLGISVADAPKKVHLGRGSGKLGDVELTPDQRDKYADVGGHLAHDILAEMVNSEGWDDLPDLLKKRAYQKTFHQAHRAAAAQTLPADLRAGLINQIVEKVQAELE